MGKKEAFYSLPKKLAVGKTQGRTFRVKGAGTSGRGPDISGLTPELPVPRKFPEQTSGAKFRTPTREKSTNDLAKFSLGRIFRTKDRNFRTPGNFRNPSREKREKDLAKNLGRKNRAGYSGVQAGTSAPQKNNINCNTKTGISFASGLRFR